MGVVIELRSHIDISPSLSLQLLQLDDAGDIWQLVQRHRAELAKYLYWVDSVNNLATTRRYIEQRLTSELPNPHWYKIVIQNRTAGVFGVKTINETSNCAELGYWVSPQEQGKGIVSSAIQALITELKSKQVAHIKLDVFAENKASQRVAEKAGAKLIAVEPNAKLANMRSKALLTYQIEL
ncbi:GNAT family N-acetyltransferase [Thalassotalea euphylliae]|uniref:GNAT family N-acetyltransferase n=1 Tax=Thalassotalea euphylliae TaxID=1655234 RepID=UPI0036458FF5